MNRRALIMIAAAMPLMLLPPPDAGAQELDDHLKFFEPFLDVEWIGGYAGQSPPDIVISMLWEPVLDGKAVRYTRTAPKADFKAVTHFYWHPQRGEVCFIHLNNRGIAEEGVARPDSSGITLTGKSHRADRTVEFETILRFLPDGRLRDTYRGIHANASARGHVQEFEARRRTGE